MITITHTHQDGTLVDGTDRSDGSAPILKACRFRWFPSLGMWGIPQSRDRLAKRHQIDSAATQLRAAGFAVTVEIDETVRRDFATAEAERYERADRRADLMTERAANAAARSKAAHVRAHSLADAIPFGQPILVGHHSEGRHRRDLDRIHNLHGRGFEEGRKAEHYERRAESAERTRAHRESIPATLRRIERLEAEQRQLERRRDGSGKALHGEDTPATGAYRERLTVRLADIADELAYWRQHVAEAQASGVKVWSRADFVKGDYVRSGGRWHEVERVNAKSVSVPHGNNDHLLPVVTRAEVRHAMGPSQWTRKITYDEVTGRKSAEDMAAILAEAERRAAAAV